MFDIKTLAIKKTADVPVKNVAGDKQSDNGKPLTITVHSPGTKAFNEAQHKRAQKNSDRMVLKMQGKPDGSLSADDAISERAEFLSSITVSFNNFGNGDLTGSDLFKSIYSDLELGHIADDVEKFVSDRANFI